MSTPQSDPTTPPGLAPNATFSMTVEGGGKLHAERVSGDPEHGDFIRVRLDRPGVSAVSIRVPASDWPFAVAGLGQL